VSVHRGAHVGLGQRAAAAELPENMKLEGSFKGRIKSFETTMGLTSSFGDAHIIVTIDQNENFKSNVKFTGFDLGKLLKDTAMYGPVTMTAEANGHGLDTKTIKAKIKADVSQIYLKKYNYHNLIVDGNINGEGFEGKINLNDPNAIFQEKYNHSMTALTNEFNEFRKDTKLGQDSNALTDWYKKTQEKLKLLDNFK